MGFTSISSSIKKLTSSIPTFQYQTIRKSIKFVTKTVAQTCEGYKFVELILT